MSESPKNILLVMCDQLSATALKAWGNKHSLTPAINSILEKGAHFENAYTTYPLCQPARASLWTGLYPHQTGVDSNGRLQPVPQVPDTMETLGSVFSQAGFTTVHFGKRHDAGSLRGFTLFPVEEKDIDDAHPAWPLHYDSKQDRNTREQAVSFLQTYTDPAPFLAVVDLNNPHDICNWVGDFQKGNNVITPPTELPPLPENLSIPDSAFEALPLPVQYVCCAHNRQAQIAEWDETAIRHYLAAYYHYIQRVDADIGKLLEVLDQRHDADETLIVFMADHGDAMGSRWMATKHTTFYDETTHIPLAFAGPGITPSQQPISGLVSTVDLFPTLCDLAGLDISSTTAGRSLRPWLQNRAAESPHPFVVSEWHTEWGFTIEPGRMIRSERFKYTHYLEGNGEELYDLEQDPLETQSLAHAPEYAEVLEQHRALLREHTQATDDPYFSLTWKADQRWRSHQPGYRNHRGPAAPQASTEPS